MSGIFFFAVLVGWGAVAFHLAKCGLLPQAIEVLVNAAEEAEQRGDVNSAAAIKAAMRVRRVSAKDLRDIVCSPVVVIEWVQATARCR